MLEVRNILEGVENFNSPILQEFAHCVAKRLPEEEDDDCPLAEQVAAVANEIMFASIDAKHQPSLLRNYPHLRDYIQSSGDMQALCSEVAEVIIDKTNTQFSKAFAIIKPKYFG